MTPNNSEILSSVRNELLTEAKQSPGLLADLANLERYVAETYSARSFIELLQNADDAKAQRFVVVREGAWLLCANDGRAFSRDDFYSLCRSASSSKQRGQTIGYRGIGFKSVVGVASSVHLLSGDLQATFSRELTRSCLGSETPTPLVRVPHPLALDKEDPVFAVVEKLQRSGLNTVFVLGGLDADRIQDEFDQFDADYLLFLRHVREAVLIGSLNQSYTCERKDIEQSVREVTIAGPDRRSAWRIYHADECDLAFSLDNGEPAPLTSEAAIAHAFLPTLEPTGFGIRINADFSTDPSRTRIVFDDATFSRMDEAASAIAQMITQATLSGAGGSKIRRALTPTVELATLSLQKRSFRTELITRVKTKLSALKDQISLAPAWLNNEDAAKLGNALNRSILPQSSGIDMPQSTFLRYLGVQVLAPKAVIEVARNTALSVTGCAELLAQCVRNVVSDIKPRDLASEPIWWAEEKQGPISLNEVVEAQVKLTPVFLEAVGNAGLMLNELARILVTMELTPENIALLIPDLPKTNVTRQSSQNADVASALPQLQTITPAEDLDIFMSNPKGSAVTSQFTDRALITSRSLPAWRGAEQYVAQIMEEHGYKVEDRSRQNLGYDLYAAKLTSKHYLEVKLLDYAGQPFVITSNEEAVARESGDDYIIALTLRASDCVYIQFIRNPARNLKFVRQCRQWVWECSDYEFLPNHTLS